MATLNFDATTVAPDVGYEPVPEGNYTVVITESELAATKSGNGQRLAIEFTIVGGQYEGRKLFDGFNIDNPNEKAVQISKAQLSSLCHAVNVLRPRDSVELHNIPLDVKVVVERRNDNGEPQNRIKKFAKKGELTGSPAAAAVPAKVDGNKPAPWKR